MRDWIFLFLGLIIAYLFEFTKPWIKSYFDNRNLTIRERKKDILLRRYYQVQSLFRGDRNIWVFKSIVKGIIYLVTLVTITGIILILIQANVLTPFLIFLFFALIIMGGVSLIDMFSIFRILNDAVRFYSYKKKVRKEFEELGVDFDGYVLGKEKEEPTE